MFELIKNNNRVNSIDSLFNNILNDRYDFINNYNIDSHFSSDEKNYYLEVALPGANKKDINLNVENGTLNLSYSSSNEENFTWNNSFNKRIKIPTDVKENTISAKLKDGILSIKLEKDQEVIKSKVIDIK
tara:strand:+ start:180 stop:569 length:390 start_codon:yes stop_codon:yes gene_type:complete